MSLKRKEQAKVEESEEEGRRKKVSHIMRAKILSRSVRERGRERRDRKKRERDYEIYRYALNGHYYLTLPLQVGVLRTKAILTP